MQTNSVLLKLQEGKSVSIDEFLKCINTVESNSPIHKNKLINWIKEEKITICCYNNNVIALRDGCDPVSVFNKMSINNNTIADIKNKLKDQEIDISVFVHGTNLYAKTITQILTHLKNKNTKDDGENFKEEANKISDDDYAVFDKKFLDKQIKPNTVIFLPTNMVQNGVASTAEGCYERTNKQRKYINPIINELTDNLSEQQKNNLSINFNGYSYGNLAAADMMRNLLEDIPGIDIKSINHINPGGNFVLHEKIDDILTVYNEIDASDAHRIRAINITNNTNKYPDKSSFLHPVKAIEEFYNGLKKINKFHKISKKIERSNETTKKTAYMTTKKTDKKEADKNNDKQKTDKNKDTTKTCNDQETANNNDKQPKFNIYLFIFLFIFTLTIGALIYLLILNAKNKKRSSIRNVRVVNSLKERNRFLHLEPGNLFN